MLSTFQSIFKIEELRKRIFFTFALLVVYRIGGHIPTPGVDGSLVAQALGSDTIFGLLDLFAGGAFRNATIFALGIMPYISASIMLQLLGAVVPYLQRLQKQGEEGKRKITQYTRYLTVLISLLQAFGTAQFLSTIEFNGQRIVHMPYGEFVIITMITFTCGTIFIMWLGEQITERGIGNGISLIIFIGIVARIPEAVIEDRSDSRGGYGGSGGIGNFGNPGATKSARAIPPKNRGQENLRRCHHPSASLRELGRRYPHYLCAVHYVPAGYGAAVVSQY